MTGYEAGVNMATMPLAPQNDIDVQISRHAGLVVVLPLSDDARAWAADYLPEAAEHWTGGYVVPAHDVGEMLQILRADGLRWAGEW